MLEPSASLSLERHDFAPKSLPVSNLLSEAESANQLTHALGFCLSLAAAAVMVPTVWRQADLWRTVGCLIYVLSLVTLYGASTLSHSFCDPARRSFYRMLDQVCIFLLLAGSYTPFGLVHLRHGVWGAILAVMWLLAAIGIWIRVRRGDGSVPFAFFVLIGWMPILALGHIYSLGGALGLSLVIGGGAAYSGGLWFLTNDHRHPYLHAVWHLATITGSACHFLFLQWYVAEWPLT